MTTSTIRPEQTLAELATTRPGAVRVFHRHGLDFCCGGNVPLTAVCADRGLDAAELVAEIEAAAGGDAGFERWDERSLDELIDHILERYHAPHREDVPLLVELARKVEDVHAEKAACPRGLADLLARLERELELHMQKEEQILFPLLRAGRGRMAVGPIQVMEQEHDDVARDLAELRAITGDYTPPEEACATWRALYLGLAELESALTRHVHLENNVLFPRALRG